MSVSEVIEPAEASSTREAHALAFRIAFTTAIGFTLGYVLGWDFPFLPALVRRSAPDGSRSLNLQQAVGFAALMTAGCIFSILIAQIFVQTPAVLLLIPRASDLLRLSAAGPGSGSSGGEYSAHHHFRRPFGGGQLPQLAYGLVYSLIAGSILAALLVFLAYAVFPSRDDTSEATKRPVQEGSPIAAALANAAALVSLVILFMLSGSPVTVIVIMTASPSSATCGCRPRNGLRIRHGQCRGWCRRHRRLPACELISVVSRSLAGRVVFRAGLWRQIAEGAAAAPVYVVALATFLIVLGLGLTPLRPTAGRSSFLGLQRHHCRRLHDRRR